MRAKNRPGEAAILEITGKSWREWFVLLNAAGLEREQRKKVIAANTRANFWWRNVVLVAYELDRGMRQQYARPVGYEFRVSRAIAAPAETLFRYWAEEDLRHAWLDTKGIEVQSASDKSMRISWEDGASWLNVGFSPLDGSKTRVVVKHRDLPRKRIEEMKVFWARALKNLKTVVEMVAEASER